MRKIVILAAAAALALSASDVASAKASRPLLTNKGTGSYAHPFVHAGKNKVLYDQNSNDSGVGIVSQNFETDLDAYDSQGADDFTIPDGAIWTIREVDVTGAYFQGTGPATSETVIFYKSKNGQPGRVVAEFDNVTGVDSGTGSFAIGLGTGAKLRRGHYWVSVQVNMDLTAGGQWEWENGTTQYGNAAVWENPGDGYATGCTTYQPENNCSSAGQGPDFMFALKGASR